MALEIIWTKRAAEGYENVVEYLVENFTDKEVERFIHESTQFFELLREFPEILPKTNHHKNVYRDPLNRLTIITYRVKPRKKQIELINIRSARQKPIR